MKRLRRLCEATRAISHQADLKFFGIPDREDSWVVRVAVRDAILVETAAGPLESVIEEATKKLSSMSQRVIEAAARNLGAGVESANRESSVPPPLISTPLVPPAPPSSTSK